MPTRKLEALIRSGVRSGQTLQASAGLYLCSRPGRHAEALSTMELLLDRVLEQVRTRPLTPGNRVLDISCGPCLAGNISPQPCQA